MIQLNFHYTPVLSVLEFVLNTNMNKLISLKNHQGYRLHWLPVYSLPKLLSPLGGDIACEGCCYITELRLTSIGPLQGYQIGFVYAFFSSQCSKRNSVLFLEVVKLLTTISEMCNRGPSYMMQFCVLGIKLVLRHLSVLVDSVLWCCTKTYVLWVISC